MTYVRFTSNFLILSCSGVIIIIIIARIEHVTIFILQILYIEDVISLHPNNLSTDYNRLLNITEI